ncbi:MAG: DUF192 domain-containing protein [Deltaproteobacteria bacterium]|nr:DUF192 domain-containing protein [Deltaproteobacteria bacterium]
MPFAVVGGLLVAGATALAVRGCRQPGEPEPVVPLPEECAQAPELPPLGTGEVEVRPVEAAPVRVRVELAVTDAQRQFGLMCRRHLDADAGMLFVFPPPARHQSFWMRNTLIPLDMIFIDAERTVLGVVEETVPLSETSRSVPGDSLYVLEVNGGFALEHGIGKGARVEIIGPGPGTASGDA